MMKRFIKPWPGLSVCLICLLVTNLTWAQSSKIIDGELKARMAISPPRLEIQLPEDGLYNGEFAVINVSDTVLNVELSLHHWDIDENNQVRIIEPTEQSLDQWLVVNPLKASIPENSTQTVRFAVRPRVKPLIGEHRAMIYIRELPDQARTSKLTFRVTYGLPVYAHVGDIQRNAIVHSANLNNPDNLQISFTLDAENTGRYYVRPNGRIGIWKLSEYPGNSQADEILSQIIDHENPSEQAPVFQKSILSKPILPATRRTQITQLSIDNLEKGQQYIARVAAQIGENKFSNSVEFER